MAQSKLQSYEYPRVFCAVLAESSGQYPVVPKFPIATIVCEPSTTANTDRERDALTLTSQSSTHTQRTARSKPIMSPLNDESLWSKSPPNDETLWSKSPLNDEGMW